MPHIQLREGLPGIRGLLAFRPETARRLNALVDTLLHEPASLAPGERELIATYVSTLNDCQYCQTIHGAVAAAHHDGDDALVAAVKADPRTAPITPKLRALLKIAALARESGKSVTSAAVDEARAQGASDLDIHDTVLITAAFCMFNRYVDGLGTTAPTDPAPFKARAGGIVKHGYARASDDIVPPR